MLSRDQEVPLVVTDAHGTATLTVDQAAATLDFSLDVIGIDLDGLFDTLVEAPVGPVHLHNAPAGSNGPIMVPLALDTDTYNDTEDGFGLNVVNLAYGDAAALAGCDLSFGDFVSLLQGSAVYINIHTDAFASGELSGRVSPVPLPASAVLLIAGLGSLVTMRRGQG
ncbi:CHRD domain-containing protein [Actibacterium sp. 188UL27-1]|uniref:CHRD domain-containing protein n=1 Tax=Actibacterium sp. 188UL27-1 TaxID=2786961 RepID=UPI00351C2DFF